jgi:hypothetical protein
LGELGMYIINPKSIIYMDPTRPGQLGHPGQGLTSCNVTRHKLFPQGNTFSHHPPPRRAAW